jgi:hypothetical protein
MNPLGRLVWSKPSLEMKYFTLDLGKDERGRPALHFVVRHETSKDGFILGGSQSVDYILWYGMLPLTVNGNDVVDGDNIASNGVVHKIDGVFLPSWVCRSLGDRVNVAADLSTLFSFLVLAGIDLSGPSALTVVGPTNEAFGLLETTFVAFLQTPDGLPNLT